MLILFDIGNTHTHLGLANSSRILAHRNIATRAWFNGSARQQLLRFVGSRKIVGAAFCSVVPRATALVTKTIRQSWGLDALELNARCLRVLAKAKLRGSANRLPGIEYPKPETIGPDRLANAIAAQHKFGAPVVVVDFGTAVTFDVVNGAGNYVGGVIAPGLAAMTEYLHEKTALLPRIKIREIDRVIGKSTQEAMLVGTVHGYRGLIRELIKELRRELRSRRLPVVATGGYAQLIAARLPEIGRVEPLLTLEGLRLAWEAWSRE